MAKNAEALKDDRRTAGDLVALLEQHGYSDRAIQKIMEWYRTEPDVAPNVVNPVAILSEIAEEAMKRLGADFKVTVKDNYRKFPLRLEITVEEYKEEAKEHA